MGKHFLNIKEKKKWQTSRKVGHKHWTYGGPTTAKLNFHSVVGPDHVKAKLISMLANVKVES